MFETNVSLVWITACGGSTFQSIEFFIVLNTKLRFGFPVFNGKGRFCTDDFAILFVGVASVFGIVVSISAKTSSCGSRPFSKIYSIQTICTIGGSCSLLSYFFDGFLVKMVFQMVKYALGIINSG